jgi:TATA-box binding protein (TBP) (component of TFIID and TFIIIB)
MNSIYSNQPKKISKPTDLVISTCTVVSNINNDIDLNFLSRIVPIYDMYDKHLEEKDGGIYNITLYSDYNRGNIYDKKVKNKEFNNQVTIKFKYWGFRYINMKVFTNGKLQMTGLKTEIEAVNISNKVIQLLKNVGITIHTNTNFMDTSAIMTTDMNTNTNISNQTNFNSNSNKTSINNDKLSLLKNNINEYQLVYSLKENIIEYYRWKNENINQILNYIDLNYLNNVKWLQHKDILKIIDNLDSKYQEFEMYYHTVNDTMNKFNQGLHNCSIHNKPVKDYYQNNGECLVKLIMEFNNLFPKHPFIWDTDIDIKNESSFQYVYQEYINNIKNFHTDFKKSKLKVKNVAKSDVEIVDKISKVILPKIANDLQTKSKNILQQKDINTLSWTVKMSDLYIVSPNYHISSINTELINSDYTCGFNIDLNILSAFLKRKYKIYNSYKPDEYPGVLTKYYYHPDNKNQGICECEPHCSIKDKKSRCCKITISIFRPGSIIITGAKSIPQLKHTYDVINKILSDNYKYILGTETEEEKIKKNPNENRKICRKPRLFYVEKTNIGDLPIEYAK